MVLLALALAWLAACAVVTAPQSPASMNVSIEIQYFQQGKTQVFVGFTTAKLDPVEFVSGETVACNGQFLRYDAGRYTGDVAKQPDTGEYTITYTPANSASSATPTSGGTSGRPVSSTVKVVAAPVTVTAPQPGAVIPIPTSAPLLIQYQPSTLASTHINALATDGRGHLTFTLPETESGTIAMPADNFTTFQGGPGTLSVVRETINKLSGTPFLSAETHFKNITQVQITWQ
jgi:hypothetical protein